jgi:hypothetical protein
MKIKPIKMRRFLMIYLLLSIVSFDVFSQSDGQEEEFDPLRDGLGISEVVPPSPSAASLGRFGDYPVNLAFGTPNIDIPLFTINAGDINWPVALSYNSSGNKVSDRGKWPGLGWSINSSGIISRTMNGKADELRDGFLQVDNGFYIDGVTQTNQNFDYIKNFVSGRLDAQPDVFSYSFGNYSGKFVFNHSGEIQLIPYQPIKIIPIGNNTAEGFTSFTIITPDGFLYAFEQYETTEIQGEYNSKYTSAWYLTSITSPSDDVIHFSYDPEQQIEYPADEVFTYVYYSQPSMPYPTLPTDIAQGKVYDHRTITSKKLREISYDNRKITFLGNSISVEDVNGTVIKTIRFLVDTFNDGECAGTCRKKLNGIEIINSFMPVSDITSNNKQKWTFEYEDVGAVPTYNSYDRDHWGYYNGAGNSDPVPTYRSGTLTFGGGADRNTDPDNVKFGLLNKIIYPTGGYTTFKFGANKVANITSTGEARLEITDTYTKKVTADNNNFTSEQFDWPGPAVMMKAAGPTESEVFWYPLVNISVKFGMEHNGSNVIQTAKAPTFLMRGNYVDEPIKYQSPTDETFNPKFINPSNNLYETTQSASATIGHTEYQDTDLGDYFVDLTSSGVGNYIQCTITRKGYELVPATENNSSVYVGGVRIEEITNYDNNGDFISRSVYDYTIPDEGYSSGKLTRGSLPSILSNSMYTATETGEDGPNGYMCL